MILSRLYREQDEDPIVSEALGPGQLGLALRRPCPGFVYSIIMAESEYGGTMVECMPAMSVTHCRHAFDFVILAHLNEGLGCHWIHFSVTSYSH
ncbi:hypothetical protein TNCV_3113721 [Trichonephila clavipes]|nr:hypothetical protein TNCV_3113721 [Trichonephila clavipes]